MLLLQSELVAFPGRRVTLSLADTDASDEAIAVAFGAPDRRVFISFWRHETSMDRRSARSGVHDIGSVARLVSTPGALAEADVEARARMLSSRPIPGGGIDAEIDVLPVEEPSIEEIGDRMRRVRELFVQWARQNGRLDAMAVFARRTTSPSRLVYAMASFGPFVEPDRQAILEALDFDAQLSLVERRLVERTA